MADTYYTPLDPRFPFPTRAGSPEPYIDFFKDLAQAEQRRGLAAQADAAVRKNEQETALSETLKTAKTKKDFEEALHQHGSPEQIISYEQKQADLAYRNSQAEATENYRKKTLEEKQLSRQQRVNKPESVKILYNENTGQEYPMSISDYNKTLLDNNTWTELQNKGWRTKAPSDLGVLLKSNQGGPTQPTQPTSNSSSNIITEALNHLAGKGSVMDEQRKKTQDIVTKKRETPRIKYW